MSLSLTHTHYSHTHGCNLLGANLLHQLYILLWLVCVQPLHTDVTNALFAWHFTSWCFWITLQVRTRTFCWSTAQPCPCVCLNSFWFCHKAGFPWLEDTNLLAVILPCSAGWVIGTQVAARLHWVHLRQAICEQHSILQHITLVGTAERVLVARALTIVAMSSAVEMP